VALTADVVIPARNAEPFLGSCLSILALARVQGLVDSIVVVDDGSTDGTGRVAAMAGATVVRTPGAGPAAARNAGAKIASGDIVVFLDADCVPESSCLAALLAPFADPEVAAVRGSYLHFAATILRGALRPARAGRKTRSDEACRADGSY
jgi:glycosyltransferase involved in cell wall biosynthesis